MINSLILEAAGLAVSLACSGVIFKRARRRRELTGNDKASRAERAFRLLAFLTVQILVIVWMYRARAVAGVWMLLMVIASAWAVSFAIGILFIFKRFANTSPEISDSVLSAQVFAAAFSSVPLVLWGQLLQASLVAVLVVLFF